MFDSLSSYFSIENDFGILPKFLKTEMSQHLTAIENKFNITFRAYRRWLEFCTKPFDIVEEMPDDY